MGKGKLNNGQATLLRLFRECVTRQPEAIALSNDAESLTFRDLSRQTDHVAWRLRRHGTRPETFVGVCLDRSIGAVVAILGVLRAGGAYVPLDPQYPSERLNAMIREVRPLVIVTSRDTMHRFSRSDATILCIEDLVPEEDGDEERVPDDDVTPGNAAYVIFTSGSGGTPKGVVQIHRSLVARLRGPIPDMRPDDVCALSSSLSFSASTSRFLLPLAMGARVVVLGEDEVRDPAAFRAAVARHGITSMFAVPGVLLELLDTDQAGLAQLGGLRAVAVGGEAVRRPLVEAFRARLPRTLLVSLYGSTEIGSTAAMRVLTDGPTPERIPIGRPVPGTRIHILDGRMNTVPAGATGTIYVGAPHLARGYLNRPELATDVFVADPFGGPGDRLCRTGDLGRCLPNGEIEFMGRADHQVKIRGFRVELEEIEGVLEDHPGVQEAAAIVCANGDDARLTAYVAPRGDAPLAIAELRAHVADRLPDYMIPSVFFVLPELPRTGAGKLDRKALGAMRGSARPAVPRPGDPVAATIADIWSELLGDPVGLEDNFFEIGGDSLLAMRASTRLRERLGVGAPVRLLFDHPTVAELAVVVKPAIPDR